MARRDWPFMARCGHDGCKETATYRYSTKRDLISSVEVKNYSNGNWRCIRHTRANEVLSPESTKRIGEVEVVELHGKHFFGNFGSVHGPGFKAFADDFPVGTKLIVTAEIVLPE